MLKRSEWLDEARKLDWTLSYVREEDAFPPELSGEPWLPGETWRTWEEPFRTSYTEYVTGQAKKEAAVAAVREAIGSASDFAKLDPAWLNALKLHAATLPLAEFAAVVGNLRGARASAATPPGAPPRPSAPSTSSATRRSRSSCSTTS